MLCTERVFFPSNKVRTASILIIMSLWRSNPMIHISRVQSPPVHTNLQDLYEPVVLRTSRASQTCLNSILPSCPSAKRLPFHRLSHNICLYFLSFASKVIKRVRHVRESGLSSLCRILNFNDY